MSGAVMAAHIMSGPSRGPAVLIVTAIMLVLSTLFVLLRMVSKFGIVRKIYWDDYFMVLAWVSGA